jgi:hypothetical protein
MLVSLRVSHLRAAVGRSSLATRRGGASKEQHQDRLSVGDVVPEGRLILWSWNRFALQFCCVCSMSLKDERLALLALGGEAYARTLPCRVRYVRKGTCPFDCLVSAPHLSTPRKTDKVVTYAHFTVLTMYIPVLLFLPAKVQGCAPFALITALQSVM